MLDIATAVSFRLGRPARPEDLTQFQATPPDKLPIESVGAANLRQLPGVDPDRLDGLPAGRDFFSALEFGRILPFRTEILDRLVDFPKLRVADRRLERPRKFAIVPDVYVVEGRPDHTALASAGYRITAAGGARSLCVLGPATGLDATADPPRPDLLKRTTADSAVLPGFRDRDGRVRIFVPRRLDVWFDRQAPHRRCLQILESAGLRPLDEASERERRLGLWRAVAADEAVGPLRAMARALAALTARDEVLLAEPDEAAEDDFSPLPATGMALPPPSDFSSVQNDFLSATQRWSGEAIGLAEGHGLTRGASSVKLFVIDSGIDSDHPNLAAAIWSGWQAEDLNFDIDAAPEAESPEEDTISHGTAVASMAAGQGGAGPLGVAPGCALVPIKIAGVPLAAGYGLRAAAIQQALDLLAPGERGIINLSWRTAGEHQGIREALRRARDMDVPVVAAAGNYHPFQAAIANEALYPAAHAHREPRLDNVISVGAVNASLERASYSYYGSTSVTVAAPGGEVGGIGTGVFTAEIGGDYRYVAGTSFAAPQVAGLLALILSRDPAVGAPEAIRRVTETCTALSDQLFPLGRGIIDVPAALSRTAGPDVGPTDPGPDTDTDTPDPDGPVNINHASVDELAALPPLTRWHAEGIVDHRETHGLYNSAWNLVATGRIGFPLIQQLLPLVTV